MIANLVDKNGNNMGQLSNLVEALCSDLWVSARLRLVTCEP